ncbi:hypothetical protein NCS52_00793200 [Fusarium sp. LHS14.1]|nr:hypothetical protein NCS52_00793200 [Fusarium sp. LHS14.1]
MSFDPQQQCLFITRLPRELRDAIYLELWRPYGLRQHIFWHGHPADPANWHYCRWQCTTDFDVIDKLQEDLELLRIQQNVPFGDPIRNMNYEMRLLSPWLNHWACGELCERVYGENVIQGTSTGRYHCWKDSQRPLGKKMSLTNKMAKSPYMPMLLACKLISEECLKSIYESITFVFTDLHSWQSFVGFCDQDTRMRNWPKVDLQPQAFTKYCKHLELSMTALFPRLITCSSPKRTPQTDRPHDPYDFHWLRLDNFQNLQSIKIWVTARSTKVFSLPDGRYNSPNFTKITDLNIDELKEVLSCFAGVNEFVISTPLSNDIGPEDGLVEGILTKQQHRVWKRGTGDFFHPRLSPQFGRGCINGRIYTSIVRQILFPRDFDYVVVDTSPPSWPALLDAWDDPAPGMALINGPDSQPVIRRRRRFLRLIIKMLRKMKPSRNRRNR